MTRSQWFFLVIDVRTGQSKDYGPYKTQASARRERNNLASVWRERYDFHAPREVAV